MSFLSEILTVDELEELIDTFDETLFQSLDDDNVKSIMIYLRKNEIYFIKDIIIQYLDLFLIEKEEFVRRFEQLKQKHSNHFIESLEEDLSILEEMLASS